MHVLDGNHQRKTLQQHVNHSTSNTVIILINAGGLKNVVILVKIILT